MLRTSRSMLIACCFLMFCSCTKKGATGPTGATGPAGPSYKGVIDGHVSIYDGYGSKMFTGLNNVQVSLDGVATVTADATGCFIFNNVSTGTYSISATGSGLAGALLSNVSFLKDTLYTDVKLSAKPQFNINSFAAYHNPGSAYDSLVIGFTPDTRPRNCIIFVNKTSAVANTPGHYLLTYIKPLPVTGWNSTIVVRVPAADLNYAGIFYGNMVYYAAASYVVNDESVYEDHATGQNVYNAVGNIFADSTASP